MEKIALGFMGMRFVALREILEVRWRS